MDYNFIAIEGNIGSGKTSLATKISKEHNAKLILEQFEDNPFLPKFYNDPDKYSFPLELSFLAERYNQLKAQLPGQDLFRSFTVSDYFIVKSLIFAQKTLKEDEYNLYSKLFSIINASLPKPDLLVYLYVTPKNLIRNIEQRGRAYEKNIEESYLEKIQNGYFDYLKSQHNIRVLILDTNSVDFVNNEKDYRKVVDAIFQPYNPGITRIIF